MYAEKLDLEKVEQNKNRKETLETTDVRQYKINRRPIY